MDGLDPTAVMANRSAVAGICYSLPSALTLVTEYGEAVDTFQGLSAKHGTDTSELTQDGVQRAVAILGGSEA